jgi:hypothetical protein
MTWVGTLTASRAAARSPPIDWRAAIASEGACSADVVPHPGRTKLSTVDLRLA